MEHEARQPRRPVTRVSNTLLVMLVLAMALWFAFTRTWPRFRPINTEPRLVVPRGDLADSEATVIEVFEKGSPSVVFVTNQNYVRNSMTREVSSRTRGAGTGIIWDTQGHILTNYHVIRGAERLVVTLADETSLDAIVVGYSARHDLAVLRIIAPFGTELRPIPLGESANLRVGQTVFAIGNPFGLDQTLTQGIISALNRDIRQSDQVTLRDMIQTDAAINPGNSGGPLLDSAGRLIGVTTALMSPSQASAGIGFAVPVDTVNQVVPQLIAHGREIRPYLGVMLRRVEIMLDGERSSAMQMRDVLPDSPASRAGLRGTRYQDGRFVPGDVLLEINGQPVHDRNTFSEVIGAYEVGDTVTLLILRGRQTFETELTLGANPNSG